jgi:pimeloyl-ACP methyl ester carboxylesterase
MNAPRSGGTRFVERNNARLAYDPGPPAAPDRSHEAAVLLHDLLADRWTFAGVRESLAGDVRVISPDARGHGASATVANQWYTVAELALDVLAILDLEAVQSAHLVGHGLGGAIAFELTRRFGERIRSITLIEPALYTILDNDADPNAVLLRNELRASDRAAGDASYKGLIDKSLDIYLTPRWGENWRQSTTQPRLAAIRRHASSLAGLAPALDAYSIAKTELRQFLVPAVVVTGEDANPIDRLVADRLETLLPVARAVTMPFGSRENRPIDGGTAGTLASIIREMVGA